MNNIEFIKNSLEHDLEYWEIESQNEPDNKFYQGTVAGLKALKEKIKYFLEG